MENWKQTHCAQICTAYVKLTESAFDAFARPCFCVPKFRLWLSAPLSFFGTFLVPYCKYLKVPESKQVWVLDLFFSCSHQKSVPFCTIGLTTPFSFNPLHQSTKAPWIQEQKWFISKRKSTTLLYEMPSNSKGKNFV